MCSTGTDRPNISRCICGCRKLRHSPIIVTCTIIIPSSGNRSSKYIGGNIRSSCESGSCTIGIKSIISSKLEEFSINICEGSTISSCTAIVGSRICSDITHGPYLPCTRTSTENLVWFITESWKIGSSWIYTRC